METTKQRQKIRSQSTEETNLRRPLILQYIVVRILTYINSTLLITFALEVTPTVQSKREASKRSNPKSRTLKKQRRPQQTQWEVIVDGKKELISADKSNEMMEGTLARLPTTNIEYLGLNLTLDSAYDQDPLLVGRRKKARKDKQNKAEPFRLNIKGHFLWVVSEDDDDKTVVISCPYQVWKNHVEPKRDHRAGGGKGNNNQRKRNRDE